MHYSHQSKRFIFTGTPGSGKTSVINNLKKFGYTAIDEAATDVIYQEQNKGISEPWLAFDFIDKVALLQKKRQLNSSEDLQFYDRSPFCTYALGMYLSRLKNIEFKPSSFLHGEIDRCLKNNLYSSEVFFFENLGFIEHTEARKISYQEALIFEKIHLDVYQEFGFQIVMVPKALTVRERCEFIVEEIG
jgi:predicted ATPase